MITRLRRLLASEPGYTLIELLMVMVILTVIVGALTGLFVQASNAELDMNRRFQAQQQARVAVDRMRREIHCASAVSPAGNSGSISVTVPSHCPTAGGVQGGPAITVTYRTVLISTARYKLERQVGTGPIANLADYIRVANVFTYTAPTTTSLGKLRVDLPINIQPPGSGSNWELVADMVLRNTSRLP
jgi:prepilin-type N-terminal cleavage/methylation domain-containing protein